MKLIEHYTNLAAQLRIAPIHSQEQKLSYQTTIAELAELLHCTKRHTKLIIKQLAEHGWIRWEIQRGRGNKSCLTFLVSEDELAVYLAKELIQQGKYPQAIEQIESIHPALKEEFRLWLQTQLGFSSEKRENKEIDVLRYPFYKAIKNLDPIFLLSRHDVHIADQLFDTLVQFNPKTNEIQPHLAHHWETNEQGDIWTFYLRKGVRFHHGRELTASDVVASFQRLKELEPDSLSWVHQLLTDVHEIHPTIVQFRIKEMNVLFPHYLSSLKGAIIPLECWQKDPQQFSQLPVGSGAFKLIQNDDSMLILEANEHYFNGRAYLDRVEIINLPELYPENQQISFWLNKGKPNRQSGNIKLSQEQSNQNKPNQIRQIEKGATYCTFNLFKDGPQQLLPFRKLVAQALDLGLLTEHIGQEYSSPAYSFFPEKSAAIIAEQSNQSFQKQQTDDQVADDQVPEMQLVQKLKQAGYHGERFYICGTEIRKGANVEKELRWIEAQLSSLGIQVVAEIVPIERLEDPEFLAQVDLVVCGVALSDDTVVSLMRTYQVSFAFIHNMVGSQLVPFIDSTLNEITKEKERQKQLELFMKLEDRLREEHALLFLYHRAQQVNIYNSSIQGISLTNNGKIHYKDVWFKRAFDES